MDKQYYTDRSAFLKDMIQELQRQQKKLDETYLAENAEFEKGDRVMTFGGRRFYRIRRAFLDGADVRYEGDLEASDKTHTLDGKDLIKVPPRSHADDLYRKASPDLLQTLKDNGGTIAIENPRHVQTLGRAFRPQPLGYTPFPYVLNADEMESLREIMRKRQEERIEQNLKGLL